MSTRRGFTLLEVIVALAMMGSVLVASLLAFSQAPSSAFDGLETNRGHGARRSTGQPIFVAA